MKSNTSAGILGGDEFGWIMAISKRETGKVRYEDPKRIIKGFEQVWEANLKLMGKVEAQKNAIEDLSVQLRMKSGELRNAIEDYREFLQDVPVISAIKAWLEGKLSDPQWKERYFDPISILFQKNLIPLSDSRGRLVTLEYFIEHGHQAILEDIRSMPGWTMVEKEAIIQCYITFTRSITQLSHGVIPYGVDPDRERARQKMVSYETFIDFVSHLSERDALIAKLLYFCDVAMEEILTLKKTALEKSSSSLKLNSGTTQLPRHLFLELLSHAQAEDNSQKLVFTNVRGAQVDRTHLNQSFARACEKSVKKEKITPGTLLKLKNERDEEGLSLFEK